MLLATFGRAVLRRLSNDVNMSLVIRPWLWPGIEKEIRHVLQWKSAASGGSQPKGEIQFEDDGSNLRIQSSQTGHLVQILEVCARSMLLIEI